MSKQSTSNSRKKPLRKGRGSDANPPNRHHDIKYEAFDDGSEPDGVARKTSVGIDSAKSAISRNRSPDIPFERSVNPYRGCEHGCIYCYARPTHAWLDLSSGLDFESRLFQRPDIIELLRDEFAAENYVPSPLALSGITDAYQPIERKFKLTEKLLKLLLEVRHPVTIVTKSALIERDCDLLAELASENLAEVAFSVTTLKRDLARRLEPRASTPARRLQALEKLSQAHIPTRVLVSPVIPVLTEPELESVLRAGKDHGAQDAGYSLIRLPHEVASLFRDWLHAEAPDAATYILNRIRDARGGKDNDSRFGFRMTGEGVYADLLAQRFRLAYRKLGFREIAPLACNWFKRPGAAQQLRLF